MTNLKLERSKNALIDVDCRLAHGQTNLTHAEAFAETALLQQHRIRTLNLTAKNLRWWLRSFITAAAPALERIRLEEQAAGRSIELGPMPRLRIVELRGVKVENWTVLRNVTSLAIVHVVDPTFESSLLQVLAASPSLEVLLLESISADEAGQEIELTSPLLLPSLSKLTTLDIPTSTVLILLRNIEPTKMQQIHIHEGRLPIADQLLTELSESGGGGLSPLSQAFTAFGIDHIALKMACPIFDIKASSGSATRIIFTSRVSDDFLLHLGPSLPFSNPLFQHPIQLRYKTISQPITPSMILDIIPNVSDLEFNYIANDWLAVCESLGEPGEDGAAWRCPRLRSIKICGGHEEEDGEFNWTHMMGTLADAVDSRGNNEALPVRATNSSLFPFFTETL